MRMFKVGELVKRKALDRSRTRAYCVVVEKGDTNYTLYNNSLKCLQLVAIPVVEGLYSKVD